MRASRPPSSACQGGGVSVLSIMGEKVRIGIQAPRDIPVFRKEVYLEIQQENVAAGASARAEVDDALKRLSAKR